MGSDGVFSAEMPDEPFQAIVPLDADTAERLLSARLDPDDAPPGYAEVARLLQAAAAPADRIELTGQAAALDAFRRTHPSPAQPPLPLAGPGAAPPSPGIGLFGHRVAAPDRLAGLAGREVGGRRPGPGPWERGAGWSRWRWPERWPPVRWGCGQPAEPHSPVS